MSKSKNHSTIYFLTTLSVYLGLIVVGASPQVLAQESYSIAPKNKTIDKQKSIEISNTQDNKVFSTYLLAVKNLYEVAESFSKENKLNEYNFGCSYVVNYSKKGNWASKTSCFEGGKWTSKFSAGIKKIFKLFPHTKDSNEKQSVFRLNIDEENFALEVTFKQESKEFAEQNLLLLNSELEITKLQNYDNSIGILYKNTELYTDNDQIFVVTKLPRASIDSIIKGDNKAK